MIVTFKEAIHTQDWLQGQECDLWIGRYNIYHAKYIQLLRGGRLYVVSDQYIQVCENPRVYHFVSIKLLEYEEADKVVVASTEKQALADAICLHAIKREQQDKIIESLSQEAKDFIKQYGDSLRQLDWEAHVKIAESIGSMPYDDKRGVIGLINKLGYSKRDEVVTDDVKAEIRRLYFQRSFVFNDKDNSGIQTRIDLRHAVSVEVECMYDDKASVHITLSNGNEYDVFEEDDKDLFVALNMLYGNE